MSNYTKTTDFGAKDSLPTGDSGKIIRGTEFETEFDAISTAIATKADIAGPTFTGTLTYETISDGTISITAFVDEDDMSSNSANLVPTQQSVKAYVDAVTTELQAQDLDFQADSGGALSIDLDTETMTFTGGTGIDTTGSGNDVSFAIDSTVATLTGTQTLTNKTLTSPDVNTPDIDGGTIDGTVIGGTTPAAVSATTVSATGNITVGGTVDGRDVATDGTKLDGIESGATADQTAAEIRTLVESATDSNVFTDADHTKLDGIEANATADQTDAEIRAAVEAATDSNVFTDADHSKLDGIEAGADVTDTTNVTAAGAVMDSELTNETAVKSLDQGVATTDTPTFAGLATSANVTFGDNDKAIFGAGSDLQIYHTGTYSLIADTSGTGPLRVVTNTFQLNNAADTQNMINAAEGGAVNLYHAGNAKLATTSTGIDVTGTVTADGLNVDSGSFVINTSGASLITSTGSVKIDIDSDNNATDNRFLVTSDGNTNNRLQIGENGDFSLFEDTGTTAKLFWDASAESLGIGTSSPAELLEISSATGSTSINPSVVRISTTTTAGTWDNNSTWGALQFYSADISDGGAKTHVEIAAKTASTTGGISDLAFSLAEASTGTLTEAMRIDSSGNVGIGTDSPATTLEVKSNSTTDFITLQHTSGPKSYIGNSSVGSLVLSADEGNSGSASRIEMKVDGDEKMRIDSNGLVGIGTSAMSSYNTNWNDLVIDGGTSSGLTVVSATTGIGTLAFADGTTGNEQYRSYLQYSHNNDELSIGVAGALAATIDSSGNLKVGYSSTGTPGNGNTDTGHLLKNDGRFFASSASNSQFNRNSDGDILTFRESGNLVGSIGANSADLYIGNGDVTLKMEATNDRIVPRGTDGAQRDAAIQLGSAGNRFTNLFLSGGVYLGGTGSANKLDDYEEGTFTPTVVGGTTAGSFTYNSQVGKYVKVGNAVYVSISIEVTATATAADGVLSINGLPFNRASDGGFSSVAVGWVQNVTISNDQLGAYITPNATKVTLRHIDSTTTGGFVQGNQLGSTFFIFLSGWYPDS